MSAVNGQNFEEAATIASEFIYSLDNLPHEANHLLQEIRLKEARVQELQQDIDRDSARYVRHSIKSSSSTPDPSQRAPSPKSVGIPAKIQESYIEIQELSDEKCLLAQRLIDLITRTRARLDADIMKVKHLQGEVLDPISALGKAGSAVGFGVDFGPSGRNPAQQISESLRNALVNPSESRQGSATPGPGAVAATSGGTANKKRRITNSASIKITPVPSPTKHRSASPSAAVISQTTHARSRLRQVVPVEESEPEAGGDDDIDADDDAEDERLYCFCQKQSYGDMVACDNENGCPYEWFHLSCVGLKQPVPEKWYCNVCLRNGAGGATVSRKGRKK
ncbi:hypothetical protein AGABI2DRAFT_222106, partial [Agaricus bisporus var. bisporus H97]|uniref:hypothetical protein n=1 Tax=Agaricus bisporus var. bisporus (strain H97 / ATCC MYA-4626 / FGSC 10389) TaxID=936046 RepID=UPI00029F5FAB